MNSKIGELAAATQEIFDQQHDASLHAAVLLLQERVLGMQRQFATATDGATMPEATAIHDRIAGIATGISDLFGELDLLAGEKDALIESWIS